MSRLDELAKTKVSNWRTAGFLVLLILAGGLVWAGFAELEEVATANGEVVPQGQSKVIQHLEGGIIEAIYVREGDTVSAGDPLVQLDLGQTVASKEELRIELDGLSLRRARLKAEAQGTQIAFPEDIAARQPSLVEAERRAFEARAAELAATQSLLSEQMHQREQDLKQLDAQLRSTTTDLELAGLNFEMSSELIEEGLTSKMDHLQLQREVEALEGELAALRPAIPRAQAALQEAHERMREGELSFQREAREALGQVELTIVRTTELLSKAESQALRTEIKSPIDGVVQSLRYHTIGGVVRGGEAIMEIVPTGAYLVIEARLDATDVGYVKVGQRVVVKVSTYDFSRYGGLEGTVTLISPDAFSDDAGNTWHRMVAETEKAYLGAEPGELPIAPGMQATVEIHTGKKSVMQFLLKPVLKVREEAFRER